MILEEYVLVFHAAVAALRLESDFNVSTSPIRKLCAYVVDGQTRIGQMIGERITHPLYGYFSLGDSFLPKFIYLRKILYK